MNPITKWIIALAFLLTPASAFAQIQGDHTTAPCTPGPASPFLYDFSTPGVYYYCTAMNVWAPQGSSGTSIGVGASLPATCTVGALFFSTSASDGQNIYGCVSINVWAQQSSSGSGSITSILSGTGVSVTGGTGPTAIVSVTAPTVVIVNAQNQQYNQCPLTSSSTATVTCTMNGTLAAYANGSSGTTMVSIIANYTSISTLTVNGLLDGASNAPKVYDSGGTVNPVASVIGLNYNFQWNATFNSGAGGWQQIGAKGTSGGTKPIPLYIGGQDSAGGGGGSAWGGWFSDGTNMSTPSNQYASGTINLVLYSLVFQNSSTTHAPVTYYTGTFPDDYGSNMTLGFTVLDHDSAGGVVRMFAQIVCWSGTPPTSASFSPTTYSGTATVPLGTAVAMTPFTVGVGSCTAGQSYTLALQRDITVGTDMNGSAGIVQPVLRYTSAY